MHYYHQLLVIKFQIKNSYFNSNPGFIINPNSNLKPNTVTDLQIQDSSLILNYNGNSTTAQGSGINVNIDNNILGYIKLNDNLDSWLIKAPTDFNDTTIMSKDNLSGDFTAGSAELNGNLIVNGDTINNHNLKVGSVLTLTVYSKTISILANNNSLNEPNVYFINTNDNKLYQYNNNGTISSLVNGNFFIAISDNNYYNNKAWSVQNGQCQLLETYFDSTNLKLFINLFEHKENGSLIITNDFKIYIRVNNIWTSH
jgi:hypothetical protein